MFALMNRLARGDAFAAWGWRVPFLASVVLVVVGLAVRSGVRETPAFEKLAREGRVAREPVTEVLRHHGKEVALSALLRMSEQTPFYLFSAFVLDYGTRRLGYSRGVLLEGTLVAAALALVIVPFFGHLSDVAGRKKTYAVGAALTALWAFPYFLILEHRDPWWALVAVSLSLVPHNIQYGPQAALIAETFGTRLRYTGAGLGYQLASVIAGGPAPLIAVWLVHRWGVHAVAGYVVVTALLTLLAVALLPAAKVETEATDVSRAPSEPG
jgi:MFS family permease